MRDLIAVVVFHVQVDLTLVYFHDSAARTLSQVGICLHQLVKFTLCDLIAYFLANVFIDLSVRNNDIANRTVQFPKIDPRDPSLLAKALLMHQVKAVRRLDHHLLLIARNNHRTPPAKIWVFFLHLAPLDLLHDLQLLLSNRTRVPLVILAGPDSDQTRHILGHILHLRVHFH